MIFEPISDYDYKSYAKDKISSYNRFIKNINIYSDVGEAIKMKEFDEMMNERFYYIKDKFNLLHDLEIEKGNIPIFITTTVPSVYHESHDINGAYEALVSFRRDLYKNFKVNNKFIKISYINVIEPHKSNIPHAHMIVYIPKDFLNIFESHYYKTLKHHHFNKKGQQFKTLDNSKFSIIYLLKYVEKSTKMDDLKIVGWYKRHKIRQFTTTNIKNFNVQIWKLMLREKKYFFPNNDYNFKTAYKKIKITYDINDNRKYVIKKILQKSEDIDPFFLEIADIETIQMIERDYEKRDLMKRYKYYIGEVKYFIKT